MATATGQKNTITPATDLTPSPTDSPQPKFTPPSHPDTLPEEAGSSCFCFDPILKCLSNIVAYILSCFCGDPIEPPKKTDLTSSPPVSKNSSLSNPSNSSTPPPKVDNLQKTNEETVMNLLAGGNFAKAEGIIKEKTGINFHCSTYNGQTPLILAAQNGTVELLQQILSIEGVDVNAIDDEGKTALMHAVIENKAKSVKELLHVPQIDRSIKDRSNNSAYTYAEKSLNPEMKKLVLSEHPLIAAAQLGDVNSIHAQLLELENAVLISTESNKWKATNAPEEALNVEDERGNALIHAVEGGFTEAAEALIRKKINVRIRRQPDDFPVLFCAIEKGNLKMVECLISLKETDDKGNDAYINVNETGDYQINGSTTVLSAIMYAARLGNIEVVKSLLKRPDIDLEYRDSNNENHYDHAYACNHPDIAEEIAKFEFSQSSVETVNTWVTGVKGGNTDEVALRSAAARGKEGLVVYFLDQKNVSINSQDDRKKMTALHYAVTWARWNIALRLINSQCDTTIVNEKGETALMMAAVQYTKSANKDKCMDVIKALMANLSDEDLKAYINRKDKEGKTALMWAASGQSQEIVNLLIEKGCDQTLTDNKGRSFKDFADLATNWANQPPLSKNI
jgi:ankyrin repeat protein